MLLPTRSCLLLESQLLFEVQHSLQTEHCRLAVDLTLLDTDALPLPSNYLHRCLQSLRPCGDILVQASLQQTVYTKSQALQALAYTVKLSLDSTTMGRSVLLATHEGPAKFRTLGVQKVL